jgi:hypothetical protein
MVTATWLEIYFEDILSGNNWTKTCPVIYEERPCANRLVLGMVQSKKSEKNEEYSNRSGICRIRRFGSRIYCEMEREKVVKKGLAENKALRYCLPR